MFSPSAKVFSVMAFLSRSFIIFSGIEFPFATVSKRAIAIIVRANFFKIPPQR